MSVTYTIVTISERLRDQPAPSEIIDVQVSTSESELVRAANKTSTKNTTPMIVAAPPRFSNT